jgi:hypothetical protein
MPVPDYTLVLGIDKHHLDQLQMVQVSWQLRKPSLWEVPWIIFYDQEQVTEKQIRGVVHHPNLTTVPWPINDIEYPGANTDKWTSSQRYKMLAGFVHVPAAVVKTKYWLKVDTDSIAFGMDDWIDPEWFMDDPAIVSHPWSFTKPPDQMAFFDTWVDENRHVLKVLNGNPPLMLFPKEGSDRLQHKRIISWCSFWKTAFTKMCSYFANVTCKPGLLPAPTQDGFMWYCAARLGEVIVRPNMKDRGWMHRSSMKGIRGALMEAVGGDQDGES